MNHPKSALPLILIFTGINFFLGGGCENPIVQDLLRAPSTLENISVTADDMGAFSLTPMFSAETTDYTVTVPYITRTIIVEGRPGKDGKVRYRRGDGVVFDDETDSGVFSFDEEDPGTVILIRVDRPYMDTRIYTLTVVRGADSLLRNIEVRAAETEAAVINSSPRPLSPGFDPATTGYTVGVPSLTKFLSITGKVKPGASIMYEQDGITAAPNAELFEFPAESQDTKIRITVSMEGETSSYELTIQRPGRVKALKKLFTIVGGEDDSTAPDGYTVKFFNHGEPVVVRAAAPFGNVISSVTRREMDDSGNPVSGTEESLTSETDLYGFVMPAAGVIIEGTHEPVPAATEADVIYVRGLSDDEIAELEADPAAIPSGDGSSWERAFLNLQYVMDHEWTADKEIWISAGRVRPDWSGVITEDPRPGWASALSDAQLADKRNWSFVLKDGVKIYGGFAGTETERSGRNPALHETILSGDLGEAGKVKHVVAAVNVSNSTLLDGLTISGGNCLIDTYDPGFKIDGKALTPSNTIYAGGGGLVNINAHPWLHNVVIKDNIALYGGAVFNWKSSPVLTNVTISNCLTSHHPSAAGNVYSNEGSNLLMIGGSVSGNQGNGVFTQNSDSSSILINVAIRGNSGSGVYYSAVSNNRQALINVTITGNNSGGIDGISEAVYNSEVNGLPAGNLGNPADYWPVAGGGLNTAGPYAEGGDLHVVVYKKLNGLPPEIKTEIISLLGDPPAEVGVKN